MCSSLQSFYLGGFNRGWFDYSVCRGGVFWWSRDVLFKGEFTQWFHKTLVEHNYLPFTAALGSPLSCSFRGTHTIRIRGRILEKDNRFDINLQQGPTPTIDDLISHPINLQLSVTPSGPSDGTIIRNTFYESWGAQETTGVFPFRAGELFEIDIICDLDAFHIYTNGRYFASYKHRRPIEEVTHLSIVGNVRLYEVQRRKPKRASLWWNFSPPSEFWKYAKMALYTALIWTFFRKRWGHKCLHRGFHKSFMFHPHRAMPKLEPSLADAL